MSRKGTELDRTKLVRFGFVAVFGVAALSQAKVQLFDRAEIMKRAEKSSRFVHTVEEVAKRGMILSSDGKPLARDQDAYYLNVTFSKVPHSDAFFIDLSAATGIPASDFAAFAANGAKHRVWPQPLSDSQREAVEKVKAEWRADGLSAKASDQRSYALGDAASGVVGLFSDQAPTSGLELSQNKILSGVNGKTVGLIDRTGAFLPMRLSEETRQKVDGQNITLTIDSELQAIAADSLKEAVDKNKADSGIAIVMDPKNGDILAMANWPTFDPVTKQGPRKGVPADLNQNYQLRFEPGSTMKILTLAKAMDDGVVTPGWRLNCQGSLQVTRSRKISCDYHGGTNAHGLIGPEEAIAESCNVAAAGWALKVGPPDFIKYVEDLGMLDRVDFGMPGRYRGLFNYQEPAKILQLATVGFGQSISVPPVQLISACTILANDGKRVKPRLIKKIGDKETPIAPADQIIKPETADHLMKYMEAVVETDAGTGKTLRIPGYRLAGKTGTAERKGRGDGYVSNFIGYVPAENPKAVVLVMIDNPKGGKYYGATVAGPVFKDIAQGLIRRYNLPRTD